MWQWLKRKKLRIYLPDHKAVLIRAFDHGGHQYYQFENGFEMSSGRGLHAMVYYEEFQMRCDLEYLKKHVRAVDILLKGKTVNIITMAEIHKNLKERLDLAPFPDHIYKLASVLFFDETENPFSYDMAYNMKKIAAWRADPSMLPFLVKVPLKSLMPFSQLPSEDLKIYFQVLDSMTKMHQQKMSEALSSIQ